MTRASTASCNFYIFFPIFLFVASVTHPSPYTLSRWLKCEWVYWSFTSHATIFQLNMWWHRCAGGLKKFDLRSGSQRHRHFVGFFNVPYTDTGPPFLYGYSDKPPHLVAFYDTLGIRRTYSRRKPPGFLMGARWRKTHANNVAHTNVQLLRESSKSAPTKRGTILEGSAARMKTGNRYREMGSVYFYLINVNFLSHKSERNVELVKLHTDDIFIRYKTKIYSLPFLHSSG